MNEFEKMAGWCIGEARMKYTDEALESIAAELQSARDRALEEAAVIVDDHGLLSIAERIRSLKSEVRK